jgi:hypothetical protein
MASQSLAQQHMQEIAENKYYGFEYEEIRWLMRAVPRYRHDKEEASCVIREIAIEAANSYDPARHAQFGTYLKNCLFWYSRIHQRQAMSGSRRGDQVVGVLHSCGKGKERRAARQAVGLSEDRPAASKMQVHEVVVRLSGPSRKIWNSLVANADASLLNRSRLGETVVSRATGYPLQAVRSFLREVRSLVPHCLESCHESCS